MIRIIYHVMKADFLERVRRFSFLVIIFLTLLSAYWMVPGAETGKMYVSTSGFRGVYNSAWLGVTFGIVCVVVLPLFAFYFIKNSINRDRDTRVGQIIASTQLKGIYYILGKWLSNLMVLSAILFIVTLMAPVLQLLRGEDLHLHFLNLAGPIWLLAFPVMGMISAIAVLFESISFLRLGFGSIVFFFLWLFILVNSLESYDQGNNGMIYSNFDFLGMSAIQTDMHNQIRQVHPDYNGGFQIGPHEFKGKETLFELKGFAWSLKNVSGRILWVLLSSIVASLAVIPFDRFDAVSFRIQGVWKRKFMSTPGTPALNDQPLPGQEVLLKQPVVNSADLVPVRMNSLQNNLIQCTWLELKLLLKGQPWWWYAVALTLIIVSFAKTPEDSISQLLAIAWLWPVLIWSRSGTFESQHFTSQIVFSAPFPLWRQIPAKWISGFLVTMAMGGGVLMRSIFSGSLDEIVNFLLLALLIPSFALAAGTWSRTPRLFEVTYLLFWYIGINGGGILNFRLERFQLLSAQIIESSLLITFCLIALSFLGRWIHLKIK